MQAQLTNLRCSTAGEGPRSPAHNLQCLQRWFDWVVWVEGGGVVVSHRPLHAPSPPKFAKASTSTAAGPGPCRFVPVWRGWKFWALARLLSCA